MWRSRRRALSARGFFTAAPRSGLEVVFLAVRRAEVIDDALLEEILHRLSAVARRDAVVVLVGDDGDVADRRRELARVERLAAQQRVREDDDVASGDVGEGAEPHERVHLEELQRERHLHGDALDELRDATNDGAVGVPSENVDHDDRRALLDDEETLVDLLERRALAERLLDDLAAGLRG